MSMTAQDVRQFIQENFLFGREADFSDDDSFLELGLIDSTGVLELVAFLERQPGVVIEDTELVPENLDSINRIVAFVDRKAEKVGAPSSGSCGGDADA